MKASIDQLSGPDARRFWQHMIKRHPTELGHAGRATAEGVRWHALNDLDMNISLTLGSQFVRVFMRGESEAKAKLVSKKLEPAEGRLTEALGVPMNSSEYGRFFIARLDIDLRQESNWDAASDWLFERAESYEVAINQHGPRRG